MAAPTVTRPLATPPPANTSNLPGGLSMDTAARLAKWIVLSVLAAGLVALIAVAVVYYQQEQRSDNLRRKWDAVYKAIKDKKKISEQVAALETVAQDQDIYGSPVHAFVLMELGRAYFEDAANPKLYITERNAALTKATELFKVLATQEPFASNPTFGPAGAQNLALAYEQARKYDDAIKVLSEQLGKDGMDAHYLFNPMQAQIGRLYWLRSLTENVAGREKEYESDRENARKKLTDALRAVAKTERPEKWRETAEYIKSLVDKPGKALPDGKIPPEKPRAENKAAPGPGDAAKPADAAKAAVPTPAANATPEKKDEPKKDEKKDEKKDAPKKEDDKKSELKKEGKDSGEADLPAPILDDPTSGPPSPSGHLTFAQIQKALKEGRPAFCQCPRCAGANAAPAAARIAQ